MKKTNEDKLYNMILPPFMLMAFVPLFWALSFIGNFIIDSLVLILTLVVLKIFSFNLYIKTIVKVWLLGFLADLIGVFYLLLTYIIINPEYYPGPDLFRRMLSGIYMAVNHSHFNDFWSLAFILSGVLVSMVFIFILNYAISFNNEKFSKKQRLILSLALTICTAPYTFLLPKELFYS